MKGIAKSEWRHFPLPLAPSVASLSSSPLYTSTARMDLFPSSWCRALASIFLFPLVCVTAQAAFFLLPLDCAPCIAHRQIRRSSAHIAWSAKPALARLCGELITFQKKKCKDFQLGMRMLRSARSTLMEFVHERKDAGCSD